MSRLLSVLVLSFAVACKGPAEPTPLPTPVLDADGDGVVSSSDCDDNDASRFPGNDEVCDGVDNDCDTLVDETVTSTFYRDEDADGFGQASNPTQACEAPAGYVADATDCADLDDTVYPGADELCDAIDHNCDGMAVEGAVDAGFWYPDTDGDTVGANVIPVVACEQPAGFVDSNTDCDDASDTVFPGASELCNEADDDCDTLIDEDAIDAPPHYADVDGDLFGDPLTAMQSCAVPAGRVSNDVDCNDAVATINPDAEEVCGDDIDNDCNGVIDDGGAANWYADLDGDGYGDGPVLATGCVGPVAAVSVDGDCADDDATRNPGAIELCNGVDDDCDDVVPADEIDMDGDLIAVCAGDCDDTTSAVAPGLPEACDNGIDNDCDPLTTDEDSPDVPIWYTDADDDDYGALLSGVPSCDQPGGTVAVGEDCNDGDALVNPGVAEVCGDGVDNDCNGLQDETCVVDHCGTISSNEVWGPGVHEVTCDIEVQGGPAAVLTIQDGAEVRFAPNTHIRVGLSTAGRLAVMGSTNGVLFTSTNTVPGAYDGIRLQSNDAGSTIEGLTIEYAGAGSQGALVSSQADVSVSDSTFRFTAGDGIRIDNAELTLSNSVFDTNSDYGVELTSTASLGGFTANTFLNNLGYPLTVPPSAVEFLDADSTFTDNDIDQIRVNNGTLTTSTTWPATPVPLYLAGTVAVNGLLRPELTLQDGVQMVFAAGAGLQVGTADRARLFVEGTSLGVTMTGQTPDPGFWSGLNIGFRDEGSTITGLTVEHAGSSLGTGVLISSADVVIDGLTVRSSSGHGLEVRSGTVEVRNSTFEDNATDGIRMDTASDFAEGAAGEATFTNNVLTNNGEHPLRVPAIASLELDASSTYSGNQDDTVYLLGDTLDRSGTWQDLGVPLEVTGNVLVQGSADPVLTVEDGAEVRFGGGVSLSIGQGDDGSLIVDGPADGVLFTSSQDTPGPGDWTQLFLGANDQGSTLEGLVVEYAGSSRAGIAVQGSAPVLVDVEVRFSATDGIDVNSSGSPLIQNSFIHDNAGYGVDIDTNASLPLLVDAPSFLDNIVTGNATAMHIPLAHVSALDPSSTFDGNDEDVVEIAGGFLQNDSTWRNLGVPYRLLSTANVQGTLDPVLTVDAGVIVEIESNVSLHIGQSLDGQLLANGTAAEPVVFTSAQTPPSAGDWGALQIGTADLGSVLTHTIVEYGGSNGGSNGALQVASDHLVLDNVTSRFHANHGLRVVNGTVSVTDSLFQGNEGSGMSLNTSSILLASAGNAFIDNLEAPLEVPATYAGTLAGTDDYSNNGTPGVVLLADTVSTSQTWAALPVPYRIDGDITIHGSSDPVLTVADGATLLFAPNTGFTVGQTDDGSLMLDGHTLGVVLSSVQDVPVPGDWDGITFGSRDQGSVLLGASISYGGGNNFGGLYSSAPQLVVQDTLIEQSSHHGLYVNSGILDLSGSSLMDNADDGLHVGNSGELADDVTPTLTNNLFTGNTSYAVWVRAEDVRQLDASSTYTGNGGGVYIQGPNVTTTGSWQDLDVPFEVVSGLNVRGPTDPVLTLEDGVELRFRSGDEFFVGNGDDGGLVIDGHTLGVLVTARDSATPGAWDGITFQSRTTVADVDGLTVEYGGGQGRGNVYLTGTTGTFTNVLSRHSGSSGLYALNSTVEITDSVFQFNNDDGVELTTTAVFAGVSPMFADNEVTDNGGAGIRLPAEQVRELSATSSYDNNGEPIVILADTVETDATWIALDAPYQAEGTIAVQGSADPLLTLADGVELRFTTGGMQVGQSTTGGLMVTGATSGVYVGSTTSVAGSWHGIHTGTAATVMDLTGLTVEYGGGSNLGNLYLSGVDARLDNVVSRHSATDGVSARSGATLDVFDSVFEDNNDNGVQLDSTSALSAPFTNNLVTGNTLAPVVLYANDIAQLDPSSTYSGNGLDFIDVVSGVVETTGTWSRLDVDYVMGDVSIRGVSNPIVTIEAGAVFRFETATTLNVGSSSSAGGLLVEGTATDPVVFTANQASPAAGDWRGLLFNSACLDAFVDVDHAIVEFGGTSNGAVRYSFCDGSMSNTHISDSATNGVWVSGSTPTLDNLTFSNIAGDDFAP